jgi:hypothetical protein
LTGVTEQPPTRPGDPQSGPELEFLRRWRPLIDRVGGDGGQARAAKHMNWTTSTVSRDYKGNTLPTDERLHQLCSALQLSPNETLDLALLLRRARSARRSRGRESAPLTATAPATSSPGTGRLRDRLRGRRGQAAAGASAVGVMGLAVVIAVAFGLFGSGAAGAGKPMTQTKTPGSAGPTAKGAFSGLALEAVTIPVRSLSPVLAGAFRQGARTAHDSTITGFVFRNRGDTGLCLGAADTGPTAGQNHDPVLVSACRRAANEIWIPEQWETMGFTFTHLVNDQYQTMCLNADNLGGLSNGHIVQLWDCYPAGNEMWDFGDWHQAVSTRAESYPLFARSGRLCLDADKYDLRVGTPVRVWTQYAAANQFWS